MVCAYRSQFVELALSLAVVVGLISCGPAAAMAADSAQSALDPRALAQSVTIYRDAYGMPHIDGPTDDAVLFGFGYCQAEDYFWQLEDSYVMGLGRYAELYGKQFLPKDLRNRAFEIPERSRADYEKLDAQPRMAGAAFAAGINYYLDTHPETKPRLLTRIEPWYLLAFARAATLELVGSHLHVSTGEIPNDYQPPKLEAEVREVFQELLDGGEHPAVHAHLGGRDGVALDVVEVRRLPR